jgi:hypothetical protein
MQKSHVRSGLLAALVLILAGAAGAQEMGKPKEMDKPMAKGMDHAMMTDPVEYTVVLKGRWTAANFPLEYPAGAHFSGFIGASHGASFTLFREGAMPSAGLERLSETGRHMPLDGEIKAAIAKGTAGTLVESGPIKDFADSAVAIVKVDARNPLVSLVAMIAPSPDWFTGIASVDLRDEKGWTASKTIELWAWDSGGDDGTTYLAADVDTSPKKATTRASTQHFAPKGKAEPVATITFVRK